MLIHVGTQERVIAESPTVSGVTSVEGSIFSDSLIATLWVDSVSSGTLSVSIFTLTDTGKELLLFSFPVLSAPTTNILLKKSGVSMQRFRVEATYSGTCKYEIYVRAISGVGESSTRLLGNATWKATQVDVDGTPGILIPASLADRNGLVIKNWSNSGTVYLGESLAGADPSIGYPLAPKDALAMDISAGTVIYIVSDGGDVDIRILESGG